MAQPNIGPKIILTDETSNASVRTDTTILGATSLSHWIPEMHSYTLSAGLGPYEREAARSHEIPLSNRSSRSEQIFVTPPTTPQAFSSTAQYFEGTIHDDSAGPRDVQEDVDAHSISSRQTESLCIVKRPFIRATNIAALRTGFFDETSHFLPPSDELRVKSTLSAATQNLTSTSLPSLSPEATHRRYASESVSLTKLPFIKRPISRSTNIQHNSAYKTQRMAGTSSSLRLGVPSPSQRHHSRAFSEPPTMPPDLPLPSIPVSQSSSPSFPSSHSDSSQSSYSSPSLGNQFTNRLTLPRTALRLSSLGDQAKRSSNGTRPREPILTTPPVAHMYTLRPVSTAFSGTHPTARYHLTNDPVVRSHHHRNRPWTISNSPSARIPTTSIRLSQISTFSQLEQTEIIEDEDGFAYYRYRARSSGIEEGGLGSSSGSRRSSMSSFPADVSSSSVRTSSTSPKTNGRRAPSPVLLSTHHNMPLESSKILCTPNPPLQIRVHRDSDLKRSAEYPRPLSQAHAKHASLDPRLQIRSHSSNVGSGPGLGGLRSEDNEVDANRSYEVVKPWLDPRNNPNATRALVAYWLVYGIIFLGFVGGVLDCYFGYRRALREYRR
ncbi:hypothetical protein D9758_014069 [Tetrapyrgos nigripes]|uniref:Uncharacterized protein n=1 Tax=Tetrapyrgos nigripes TaxID=182062 RepID=A0A8H5CHJ6_9AGAR|nr:hypothetical protein D9758_014069 [Tetrapyrgos nigripes]